jgi:alpha-L-rhamnosidase
MTSEVEISDVCVEHYETGLGISEPRPRLSWRYQGDVRDWTQNSYELRVQRGSRVELHKVISADSVLVPWPAAPLSSREVVVVGVRSHGSDGRSTEWSTLKIEAALFSHTDWTAAIVGNGAPAPSRPFRVHTTFTCPSSFDCARLYITAHGVYEAVINGNRIGDELMAPGWTEYGSNLTYRVFDVTGMLISGQRNVIGAWVSHGWFAGRMGFGEGKFNSYGTDVGLLAQLEINGKIVASTDDTWTWSFGSILASEIYDGEIVDSRIDDSNWAPRDASPVVVHFSVPSGAGNRAHQTSEHHLDALGTDDRGFRPKLCRSRQNLRRATHPRFRQSGTEACRGVRAGRAGYSSATCGQGNRRDSLGR